MHQGNSRWNVDPVICDSRSAVRKIVDSKIKPDVEDTQQDQTRVAYYTSRSTDVSKSVGRAEHGYKYHR